MDMTDIVRVLLIIAAIGFLLPKLGILFTVAAVVAIMWFID
jgi:hypothetical protein